MTTEQNQNKQTPLRAFHGSQEIKEKYLARLAEHRRLDQLVQGDGWNEETHKGCAVGCTLDRYDHKGFETELGIPIQLAQLNDSIFEGLKLGKALAWPERFLRAIPVGADLSLVITQVVIWQFEDLKYGLAQTIEVRENPELRQICEDLVRLYLDVLAGKLVTDEQWKAIEQRAGAWAWAWARYVVLADKLEQLLREAPVGDQNAE